MAKQIINEDKKGVEGYEAYAFTKLDLVVYAKSWDEAASHLPDESKIPARNVRNEDESVEDYKERIDKEVGEAQAPPKKKTKEKKTKK